ncbi:MAG: type I 3-dehydroquinate dehydratase [Mobiluncus sp.]|uniref:3-dehydroquinate dehydratase n=1 Tax=Mobiluncus porci TaxID=2652278 RepID=A0A7K0K3Y2_9ACTO|nr:MULTISPECIES: type I 3-dehydroquinate dehydratase [Mobiluncus]MCI6584555.1 type I 3-dehydroquinate dehydratase [Mobiluncus sp.]MST50196.1 type I 3-dehydroquinate dehydratase [Mobiluncus porci]
MSELFADWRRPTFITSLNPGLLGYDRLLADLHPRIELVEIRLDGAWAANGAFMGKKEDFARAEAIMKHARSLAHRPVLATFRTEGGQVPISQDAYENLLKHLGTVSDFVDVESNYPLIGATAETLVQVAANPQIQEDNAKRVSKLVAELHRGGAKVILSRHFWEPSPESVEAVVDLLKLHAALGADVAKAAYTPTTPAELATLQQAGRLAYELVHIPTILIGMGALGKPTRLAGPQAGNWGTFVTVGGPASAPGQLPLAELELRYPSVG